MLSFLQFEMNRKTRPKAPHNADKTFFADQLNGNFILL